MKRIANKMCVQTLLYVVNPYQKIRILDRHSIWDVDPKKVYEGNEKDFTHELVNKYECYKASMSQVHSIGFDGDVLVIVIETASDNY